jgi:RNA polymerase-binding transcription factor DksA
MAGRRRGWRGWRAWLAAAMSVGLAGTGTIILGRGPVSGIFLPAASAIAVGRPALDGVATLSPPGLHAVIAERRIAEFSTAAAFGGHGRHRGQRALGADANGGQVQLPRPVLPDARPAAMPHDPRPRLLLPAWRSLLEARWQQRLGTLTELSLAYHDAAEQGRRGQSVTDQPEGRQLRQLLREAVAARRALSDTEEALARLTAGRYGQCEQCSTAITTARLAVEPETRYCDRCARAAQAKLMA